MRSTDVHRTCTQPGWWAGRPPESFCSLEKTSVDRPVDRQRVLLWPTERSTGQRAVALWIQARSTGRSTGGLNGHKFDRCPVDRKGNFALCLLPTGRLLWGYIYPISWLVLNKFFKSKILILSSVLLQVFKRVLEPKD